MLRLLLASAAVAAFLISLADSLTGQSPTLQPPVPAASSLDGTWEIVSVIDDGKLVPLEVVKQTMIKDARLVINGQIAALTRPDGKFHSLAFVTDASASPRTIDLAGATKIGGKGIYMRDGDTLVLCVSGSDAAARPTQLASLPGTDDFLITLRRVNAPAPPKPAPPPPPPAVPNEDGVRRSLVGTWGHQTDESVVKITFNTDNTFSVLMTYKKGFKKIFDSEDRGSGTWRLKDGEVMLTFTASTIKNQIGQIYSYRVNSINNSEVIYIDNKTGQRRVEWKLR